MSYSVGQIVRPKYSLVAADRSGRLCDWAGKFSAQGWVAVDNGIVLSNSAPRFDPNNSTTTTTPKTETLYDVVIFDVTTQTLLVCQYPESELEAASVFGQAITQSFPDPRTDVAGARNARNLVSLRT